MPKTKISRPWLWTLLAALALSPACSDVLDQLSVADEAKQLIDEITAEGGAAELLVPGVSAKVWVTDESSPIHGAYLEVPADALGDTDLDVLASVRHSAGYAPPSSAQILEGPGVEVRMFHILSGSDFTPKVAVTVGVPTTAETTDTGVFLGHQASANATEMTIVETTRIAGVPNIVAGSVTSLSPFAAIRVAAPQAVNPLAGATCLQFDDATTPFDGKSIDHSYKWIFDANGFLIQQEQDTGNDGSIDEKKEWTRDADGHITVEESSNAPFGPSDTFTSTVTPTVDNQDRLTSYEISGLGIRVFHYESNSSSVITGSTRDDHHELYTYDSDGKLVSLEEKAGGAAISACNEFTYDGDTVVEMKRYANTDCAGKSSSDLTRHQAYEECPSAAMIAIQVLRP